MANSVYKINKGINKSIEFKGLKAQYIWWLGGCIVGLLLLFAILYMIGVNSFISLAVIGIVGTVAFVWVFKLSTAYGEHGMKKKLASRKIPDQIKCYSRNLFTKYKSTAHGTKF
jgi:Domain of unknown function (DUF4133)